MPIRLATVVQRSPVAAQWQICPYTVPFGLLEAPSSGVPLGQTATNIREERRSGLGRLGAW
ncbi:hypothetical protein ARTHRO9V_280310 [Arthrobacter sp. 9V]|nr:hypothetical protein ARTHRO9V_280310 [Arthrobacter sp. 9V]